MTSSVKAYLFDLGNVIVHIHIDRFLPVLGLDTTWDIKDALAKYEQSGLSRDFELGNISFDEFYRSSCELFEIDVARDTFLAAWNAIIGDEIDGMHDIVEQCTQRAPVYLLSNTNDPHYQDALSKSLALHQMQEHFLSYRMNLLKPDPRIYTETIDRIGLPPESIFFTDDREDNIQSAKEVGLNAVQFKSSQQLREVLGGR